MNELRNTGNHAKPIRPNHAVAELMWEDGEVFRFVPRSMGSIRSAEIHVLGEDGNETTLLLGADALRFIHRELGRVISWADDAPDAAKGEG